MGSRARDLPDLLRRVIDEEYRVIGTSEARRLAMKIEKELVDKIKAQEFDWPPLSSVTKQIKQRAGLDPRTLIATGDYVNSIKAVQVGRTAWTVDVPDGIHMSSKMTYSQLRKIHEYGSFEQNVPPRPHWRTLADDYKSRLPQIKSAITRRLARRVRSRLNRDGGSILGDQVEGRDVGSRYSVTLSDFPLAEIRLKGKKT